ncbi:unnamed protein product [Prorocentrum cordatum]|uniref:Uncharacterized protein n=1 Tax=Prorocentrum cordatum TaxID=2364126 RepID=A0ABN9PU74_9DINO|nr:unnamed protein product [Polarella glacialis]
MGKPFRVEDRFEKSDAQGKCLQRGRRLLAEVRGKAGMRSVSGVLTPRFEDNGADEACACLDEALTEATTSSGKSEWLEQLGVAGSGSAAADSDGMVRRVQELMAERQQLLAERDGLVDELMSTKALAWELTRKAEAASPFWADLACGEDEGLGGAASFDFEGVFVGADAARKESLPEVPPFPLLQDGVGEQLVGQPVGMEASYKEKFAGSALSNNCSHEEASECQAARIGGSKPTALEPRACGAEALVEAPEGASKGARWADDLDEITQQVVPEVSAAAEAPTEAQQLILGAARLAREALQRGDIAEGLRLLEAAQAKCLEN